MIAFFLGSHPDISLAELRIVFAKKEERRWLGIALFDVTTEEVAAQYFKLGGVPRYGTVIAELDDKKDPSAEIIEVLKQSLLAVSRKEYVLSLFGVHLNKRAMHHALKQQVQGAKYDGKFEEAQHSPAASAHVLQRGGHEYAAIAHERKIYVIKTEQIQDAKFWSIIDAQRPSRDMKIGMLPAKLARIMINLSGATSEDMLWDPFVGQATIAMQGAMLNVPVLGTDKSGESIARAKENMTWLIKKGLVSQAKHSFYPESIEKIRLNTQVTAIVTEPFLGKPHFKPFSSEFLAKKEWQSINRLYGTLLQLASRLLKKGQRLVFVKPVFAFLANNGGRWYNPPLSASNEAWKVPDLLKDMGALVWAQRDNVVGREIIVLEKR